MIKKYCTLVDFAAVAARLFLARETPLEGVITLFEEVAVLTLLLLPELAMAGWLCRGEGSLLAEGSPVKRKRKKLWVLV